MGEVDPRFLSYNIETVEVTGGRFWKPYAAKSTAEPPGAAKNQPIGMDPSLYQYRPPINLANPKLRNLASALAPAYVRVSGTWRNTTQFQDSDAPAPSDPPAGYKGVMTRSQWKGVIDFSHAVDAEIVTSVATSDGTRDKNGVWTPVEAKPFFEFTQSAGGKIAATEFMNEPTFASMGGVSKGYDGAAFGRDVKVFREFLRKQSPGTKLAGPGSVGEGVAFVEGLPLPQILPTEDMLKHTGNIFDVFSYHFYGTVSKRCVPATMAAAAMTAEKSLSRGFFDKNVTVESFYANLRDIYAPGKPMWLTETGEAACGGDAWASTFVDSFRFMDQLGSLAQRNVKTVMVNTLASSDYGLLNEDTLEPRPNYWAALLWKRLMGTRVLDPATPAQNETRIYAQCTREKPGAVTLLIIHFGRESTTLRLADATERYTLSSPDVMSQTVMLNGTKLTTNADGTLPSLVPEKMKAGVQRFAGRTITFLTMLGANNSGCQ